jgi:hypothetical protein
VFFSIYPTTFATEAKLLSIRTATAEQEFLLLFCKKEGLALACLYQEAQSLTLLFFRHREPPRGGVAIQGCAMDICRVARDCHGQAASQ